ncbi:hypothetical protein MNEG_3569 [Monoraphidium neglectum]|uniref:Uncharacterized protein n=1 Tax=Monoraphidium neglectum TaxID=145388 RepID=A0A0D2LCB4_9CHLO|nr:hypothetical protein MNEG_3569 [Monoraphidium neglectum]KIZ04389.1 hypothetical protein MNEG_3569 [Monoraphidium neglectum]|eukprot:XP_013903408.1 hypothetical protein MNEG_3569 [Monoraphidium neglectum]
MENKQIDNDPEHKGQQRCCLGALYFSSAAQAANRGPTCIGFQHTPATPVKVEQKDPSVEEWTGYKASEQRGGSDGGAGNGSSFHLLPYCEGVEVLVASQEQTAATRPDSTAASAGAAAAAPTAKGALAAARGQHEQPAAPQQQQPAPQPRPPQRQQQPQQRQQPAQPLPLPRPSWQAVMESLDGRAADAQRFRKRFEAVAARNAQAMRRALDAAYDAAVKPVLDKLSPGGPRA